MGLMLNHHIEQLGEQFAENREKITFSKVLDVEDIQIEYSYQSNVVLKCKDATAKFFKLNCRD
jgi:hypothetical protein